MTNKRPVALVFGGSRGIGAACVETLARDGFDLAFTYVSHPEAAHSLEAQARAKGATVRSYSVDIRDADAVAAVFADVDRAFQRPLHAVIANAGINVAPGPLAKFGGEEFRKLVDVNLVGAFNVLQQAGCHVADQGTIVALTTSLVRKALPGLGPYSAAKAAVECLVRSLAFELAPRRVRVNAVAPGPVETDLFRAGKTEEALQRSAAMSPLNRVGTPAEIAEVVAFLVSEKASWMHGQVVQPNGGMV